MTVSEIRKETAERMGRELACIDCYGHATYEALSLLGGRCHGCYEANRRRGLPPYPQEHERSPFAQAMRREIEAAGKPLPR